MDTSTVLVKANLLNIFNNLNTMDTNIGQDLLNLHNNLNTIDTGICLA